MTAGRKSSAVKRVENLTRVPGDIIILHLIATFGAHQKLAILSLNRLWEKGKIQVMDGMTEENKVKGGSQGRNKITKVERVTIPNLIKSHKL